MKNVVVVYESSYGNTHTIAEAIAEGLRGAHHVEVVAVSHVDPVVLARADLVIVGGPTHVHRMSGPRSRAAAVGAAQQSDGKLVLDPDAAATGLQEWFGSLNSAGTSAAAFDTRVDGPAIITGRASKEINRQLRRAGFHIVVEPMSFLVTKATQLVAGQHEAARRWGETLSNILAISPAATVDAAKPTAV